MSRRRMMFKKSELPAGYMRCKYLESTGTQYIQLPEFSIEDHPKVHFKFFINNDYNTDVRIFGQRNDNVSNLSFGTGFNNNAAFDYGYLMARIYEIKPYLVYDCTFLDTILTINGIVTIPWSFNSIGSYGGGEYYGILPKFIIFGQCRDGINVINAKANLRIMEFCIENKFNLIPALDPSGRPCMYDTVTKQPFYNAGTGEFLYELSGVLSKLIRRLRRLGGGSL